MSTIKELLARTLGIPLLERGVVRGGREGGVVREEGGVVKRVRSEEGE